MKQFCFDIESDYYWNGQRGYLNTPEDARSAFGTKRFRFDAATAFDCNTKRYRDFLSAAELVEFLEDADELVSFNGRTCDLIVLENCVGREAVDSLRRKLHHDLKGWKGYQSLAQTMNEIGFNPIANSEVTEREEELARMQCSEFSKVRLRKSYQDAKATMELFEIYIRDTLRNYSFRDI